MNHKADKKYPAVFISFLLIAVLNTFGQQINIQNGKGILRILSEPAGAKISINEKSMGVTPLKIVNVDTGELRLSLQLQGYAVYENPVQVKANESQNVSVVLKHAEAPVVDKPQLEIFDTLAVNTIPPGAAVFINGQQAGSTPYRNEKMAPGNYKLRLELSGYDTLNGFAILKAGEFHAIEKKLTINRQYTLTHSQA